MPDGWAVGTRIRTLLTCEFAWRGWPGDFRCVDHWVSDCGPRARHHQLQATLVRRGPGGASDAAITAVYASTVTMVARGPPGLVGIGAS
jgi:hypothetical protein